KILHNVGMYAWKHRVHSLTVEGEPDQEQYDFRGDVYSVSLAGALVSLSAWQTMRGTQPWLTTFEESNDFCRRVILSGGRVVVVPKARIAHRRARFDGIRTRSGEERPVEKSSICYG
ncbi:glycosyltransferase family 2 protein, partial [Gardnerella vaginalis]